MFAEQGACLNYGAAAQNKKLLDSAAQATARERVNMAIMQPSLTGRETQIALRSPYKPLTDVARVTGLNAWPKRRMRNPRFYGFAGLPPGAAAPVAVSPRVFNAGSGQNFTPMGLFDPFDPNASGDTIYTTTNAPRYPSGPSTLQSVLDAIRATLPATISAIKSQPYYNPNAPAPVYAGAYPIGTSGRYPGQAGTSIGAQAGAAVGGIGDTIANIVQEHPLLVLGGGIAALLLFMSPPRRGR